MNRKPRAGLLPLFLQLYDQCLPRMRAGFDAFLSEVALRLEAEGLDVVRGEICCVAPEFQAAVKAFEDAGADAIVTVHLAYSPSLESIDALTATALPIVILDVTMDAAFGPDVDPDRILYNHGVHGVMDMASVLRRRGKAFDIVAGHVGQSDAPARAADLVRAATAARMLRQTRALRIGEAFEGMGDFAVDEKVLREVLGIHVDQATIADLAAGVREVTPEEIREEMAADRERFACNVPEETHRRSVAVGLGLRRMIDAGGYHACSANFQAFDSGEGPVNTPPFLELSKGMSRGIGYGGEGDVLTAAMVGALARAFGRTTFTEIFCPDWAGGTLFLSHMGEINPDVADGKADLIEKPFELTAALNPAVVACRVQPGPAVFVNLAPGPEDTFGLIVAGVEVLEDTSGEAFASTVRAWVRPDCDVEDFLEAYSVCGGTHHSALVLGDRAEALTAFASRAGLECFVIG